MEGGGGRKEGESREEGGREGGAGDEGGGREVEGGGGRKEGESREEGGRERAGEEAGEEGTLVRPFGCLGAGDWPYLPNPALVSTLAPPVTDAQQLERFLLRRGVGELAAGRACCADCGRTPLIGERVHLYARLAGVVCELCRSLRHEPPAASETVRHTERGHTVRLAARAA